MSDALIFNPNNDPKNVIDYLQNQDDPYFVGRTDVILRPDLAAVQGQPQKYWCVTSWTDLYHGTVSLMTSDQQAAVDAALAQEQLDAQHQEAVNQLNTTVWRALCIQLDNLASANGWNSPAPTGNRPKGGSDEQGSAPPPTGILGVLQDIIQSGDADQ